MEKDIIDGKIGEVGAYDVEFKGGKLVAKAGVFKEPVAGVVVKADVSMEVGARAVLEALKKAIPGQVDDFFIDQALKALEV